jgi:hypothetical protein
MRRFVPWILLGLLTVGAAVGIALGVANQAARTPTQWVANALTTTAQAGTARFTDSVAVFGSHARPEIEDRGHGLVDFTSGDASSTDKGRNPTSTTRTISIGATWYVEVSSAFQSHWAKLARPHEPLGTLGLGGTPGGLVALSGLSGYEPVVAVRQVGPADVGGAVTEYVVTTASPPLCPKQHRDTGGPSLKQLPTTVWLDQAGRIVRVRSQFQESFGPLPAGTDSAITNAVKGGETIHFAATLHFSDFGLPVKISAPPTGHSPGGEASSGTAQSRPCR